MILVSGGGGFIGGHFVAHLQRAGETVSCFQGDVTDSVAFVGFLKTLKEAPRAYFHFAGISSVGECQAAPEHAQLVNAQAPAILAAFLWQMFPECLFVFPSTAALYAPSDQALTETSAIDPQNAYAQSKWQGEQLLSKTAATHGRKLLILRLFNHSHHTQPTTFFLPSVYQQILAGKEQGHAVLKVGNIDIERDIGALSDLLDLLQKVALSSGSLQDTAIYNVSSGTAKNLRQLIEELARQLKIDVRIETDPSRVRNGEPSRVLGDSSRIHSLLQWTAQHGQTVSTFVRSFLSE